ncbi:phosphate ABC transporter ATP-binding protein [Anaerobacillus alkalidiazotrophicus]|uniref:Phosphate ABC transporter ATP-binding protein n=1 Tax=Anaerobacillus alkalidiazotrophicus TaxID=472963 RepID=A0A1S2M678_9BACI|nr:ATP-binding cassette domain-containing protein [Anaerobacillus alkalidiazotrophicus]OIJ20268.1 phosphate ABC transporter ATP-binding protein [Anaerobacillus alkalidiazotrophicus]
MNGNYELQVKNVTTPRVSDISFNASLGNIISIIGPSGAGKSSLLLLLNRLIDPIKGEIIYRNKVLTMYPIIEIRRKIGLVFQTSSLFEGTVEDNLKYGPSLIGRWNKKRGPELLEKVQLSKEYLGRDVEQLSGGQQQRVALARTLANDPEILLLDEVTSALDLQSVDLIEQLLVSLSKEKKTIIMVTHNISQAERISDKVIFMKNGTIIEQGKTEELINNPKTEELQQFLKE